MKRGDGEVARVVLFADQLLVLREQVSSLIFCEDVAHWFTVEGFQSLFALLGTNQQGIGTSALSVWVENCDRLHLPSEDRQQLDEFIDKLYEELENGKQIKFHLKRY